MAEKQSNEKDDNQYIIHVSVKSDPFIQEETLIPGKLAGIQENYFAEQTEKFISGHAVLSKMNRDNLSITVKPARQHYKDINKTKIQDLKM